MRAYKYRNGVDTYDSYGKSLFYRDVETLFNNKIYAPTISELNDPNESNVDDNSVINFLNDHKKEQYQNLIKLKEMLSKLGIYSLSMNHDNELLWSYYASGHKGFAIEYNLDFFIDSFNYFIEKMCYFIDINYSGNVPRIKNPSHLNRLLNPKNDGMIKLYLGNKSKNWKHEQESRLVLEKNGLVEYDYRSVSGIYFGYRMKKSEVDFVMKKMKGRGITYYQMKLSKNYKLEAYPLEDKYYNSDKYVVNKVTHDPKLYSKENLKDNFQYHDKVKAAVEIACSQPLVTKIIGTRVDIQPNFLINVVASSSGICPIKWFEFVLDENEDLILIEDLEREKRMFLREIKEMSLEYYD